MFRFKRFKKSRQPSQQPISPAQIAAGGTGNNTILDPILGPEGVDDGKGSASTVRDKTIGQQPHLSSPSTQISGRHEIAGQGAPQKVTRGQAGHIDTDLSANRRGHGAQSQESGGSGGGRGAKSRISERDWKDRAVGGATIALDVALGVAEVFPPLKAALATVSTFYGQYKETVSVRNKVETLLSRVAMLESVFQQDGDDEEEKERRDILLIKLKIIGEKLVFLHETSALLSFVNHVRDSEDVAEVLKDLRESINDYQMVEQNAIYEQKAKLMDAAELSAINKFRSAQGAEFRHGNRKGCMNGTREAILEKVEEWSRDFDKLPVYWLNGLAGTGKSTIAQTIAERIDDDGRLGASFFCSRYFEDRSDLQMIFPTLAVQLARRFPGFRSVFVPLAQCDPDVAYESLNNQMDKLIAHPLKESAVSTIIIIDALDECKDEEPASAILSILGRFISELPKIKFFLTGRPESRILEGFRLPLLVNITAAFILHEVEPDEVDHDIRRFFENSFLQLASRRPGLNNWPSEEELDLLCKRAAGLFIYAAATVKFIEDRRNDPRKQLELLAQFPESTAREGGTKYTTKASPDLLYASILQEAYGADDPEDDPKVRSVLGAVILAVNPLAPPTIATLLGLDIEEVKPLLSSVHSLLILHDDVNHPIRPFHKSFPDFMTDPTRCTNQRFYISPHQHLNLAVSCLNLMNNTLARNMCHLPETVQNSQVDDLQWRARKFINPALQYACQSWHKHLLDEPTVDRAQIIPIFHQFLEEKFLFWLEVLSVLNAVRSAIDALDVARKWLKGSPTFNLTDDCFYFVTRLYELISTSAPHIYHSAIMLTPTKSMVRRLYGPHANPLVSVVQGFPTTWETRITSTRCPDEICAVAWSPCSKFIAIAWEESSEVSVLEVITLEELYTLSLPEEEEDNNWNNLIFSPDGSVLLGYSSLNNCIASWNIQTGGLISKISTEGVGSCDSITFSRSGTMLGGLFDGGNIITYDISSGTKNFSHSIYGSVIEVIWTHGEYVQFATVKSSSITVWQVSFTSDDEPTEVGLLSAPYGLSKDVVLHPTLSRIALVVEGKVIVWDIQNQKVLLDTADVKDPSYISFSADGYFFVCAIGSEFFIWSESPDGYLPHQKVTSSAFSATPVVSPNRESIITCGSYIVELWHTASFPTTLPDVSTPPSQYKRGDKFLLEFSPAESMAVFAKQLGNTVNVVDLKFDNPQLVLNAGTEICGIKITEDKIVVVGDGKIITWSFPPGTIFGTTESVHMKVQTVTFQHTAQIEDLYASISPNLNCVAIGCVKSGEYLRIYDSHTGDKLAAAVSTRWIPGFTSSGNEVWCAVDNGSVDGWAILKQAGSNVIKLKKFRKTIAPSSGFPWQSPRGYQIAEDGWILDSNERQLLWLPQDWRPEKKLQQRWGRKYVAMWNMDLLEPAIVQLKP